MASRQDVIDTLFDTRAAAVASSRQHSKTLAEEIANLISDPQVMALCTDTIRKDALTVQKCDQGIEDQILAAANVDDLVQTLKDLAKTMAHQTAQLKADIESLTAAKQTATAIAGLLGMFG